MCRVFVSGRGNVFIREIAEHLVEALVLAGRPGELVIDDLPDRVDNPIENLVVAPHEFFVLSPAAEADRLRAAAASVCINTEQPGTPFFDLAMTYAACGPVVLDINRHSLDAVRHFGLAAVHLPLGCTPSMDAWGGSPRERGVDIAFMSGRTPRREKFIAGAGGMLWEWRTDVRFFSWHRPILGNVASFVSGPAKFSALADTRILLNVHRGHEPYFEWARVVEAIANGCIVASETSVGCEPLVPGMHFLMAPYDHLAEQAVALAFDEPRRAAMADAAYKLATTELSQSELLQAALTEASSVVKRGGRRAGNRPAGRPRRSKPVASAANSDVLRKTVGELKAAYFAQLELTRSIEATISLIEHGDADHADIISTSSWPSFDADVSVVIPLFNQGQYLAEAVHSVISASGESGPPTELLIVDDHSTDDSRQLAERLLGEIDWFPATLIARAANGGLPAARNVGFNAARAPYVFALDADNTLYPTGLRRLLDHLETEPSDVVAAYGIFERFDTTGSLGLTSHLPWDPDQLVQGVFVDPVAMFRREAWSEFGGYSTAEGLDGWEDYDLWLTVAERGLRADLVRSVVGRCRQHPGSMGKISDVDMASNFVILRERHPRLPWPS
ncbi:MAG: glycosyltransferase [Actinomycetota bacterium]|nr:glycosyltransferase [Actinomycetota bacterium]